MARVAVAVGSGVGSRMEHPAALSRLRHRHQFPLPREHRFLDGGMERVQNRLRPQAKERPRHLDGDVHSDLASGRSYFRIRSSQSAVSTRPFISIVLSPVPIAPVHPPSSWRKVWSARAMTYSLTSFGTAYLLTVVALACVAPVVPFCARTIVRVRATCTAVSSACAASVVPLYARMTERTL